MSHLDLYLLGTPRTAIDSQAVNIPRRKATALFAYLAITGRSHSRDSLATLLWPEKGQSSARAELRRGLYFINKALGNQWLETDLETVGLNPELNASTEGELWLDVAEFQQQLEACETHEHPSMGTCPDCIPYLENAVDLYTDHFMAGFSLPDSPEYDEWQFFQAEGLRSQLASALLRLSSFYTSSPRKDFETAIRYARRWLTLDSLHEPAHQQLMILFAQSGQKGAALRQFDRLVHILEEDLGVDPSQETIQLYKRIKDGAFENVTGAGFPITAPVQKDEPHHNLPRQLTSFIGREAEIKQALLLLEQAPQVTVIGHGGIGKTRLAIQVSRAVLDRFQDGVWLVDLAPLSDPEKVPQTAARAVGIPVDSGSQALEALLDYIRPRQMLLVLDNCEHLIDACAQLAEAVLTECPQVKILATSRETLGTTGESVHYLPSLSFPNPDDMPKFDQITQFEAIELFVSRASAVQSQFALTPHNADNIARICSELDGIPLAIELAAAWVRTLPVEQISRRLSENIDFLRGASRTALPRHQTLRACLDWSYDLLSPGEQDLLQALSIFAGGWTLEAAEAVCSESCASQLEVLDTLDQLAAKSLVIVEHHPEVETRYHLLEPVRQYAREKLHYAGKTETVRDRHLAYFQGLAAQAKPCLRGHRQIEWLRRLERELANIRYTLDWAYSEEGSMVRLEQGLSIAANLRWFWACRYRHLEGSEWMKRLLDLEQQRRGDKPISPSMCLVRAWCLTELSDMSKNIFTTYNYECIMDESKELFNQLGEAGKLGLAVTNLNQTSYLTFDARLPLLEKCFAEFEAFGEKFYMAYCLSQMGHVATWLEKYNLADKNHQEAITLCNEIGDRDMLPYLWIRLGHNAILHRDPEKAISCVERAKNILIEVEDDFLYSAIFCYRGMGEIFLHIGDHHQSKKYYQTAINKSKILRLDIDSELGLSSVAISQGDYVKARELLIDLYKTIQRKEHGWEYIFVVRAIAELEWGCGNYAQATKWLNELQILVESPSYIGINLGKSDPELGLAKIALSKRDWDAAAEHIKSALNIQIQTPFNFEGLFEDKYATVSLAAVLCLVLGKLEKAARLLGTADRSYQVYRLTFPLFRRQLIDLTIEETRNALDADTFTTAWEAGKAMVLSEALAYALEVVG